MEHTQRQRRAGARLMLALATADARNVTRDAFLAFLVLLPLLIALIYRFVLPDQADLAEGVRTGLAPDLERYRGTIEMLVEAMGPVLMSVFITLAPGVIGALYGLLLVDERDARTLAAVRVTPTRFSTYLAGRLAVPCVLSLLVTCIAYPIAGYAPIPMRDVFIIAAAGMSSVPVTTLAIVGFAPNKVAGLAVMRAVNVVSALPVLAYFISDARVALAWPIPPYWQMKALWRAIDGEPYWGELTLCLAMNAVLTVWLFRRFSRRSEF